MIDHAQDADLGAVAAVLRRGRDPILTAWLTAAAAQPFHASRPEAAVSDDIPFLFDALVALLAGSARPGERPSEALGDDAIRTAASRHAIVRAEQGLVPQDIAVEFRMLRQSISGHLARAIADELPAGDVVIALAVVSDGIDAAITLALVSLGDRIEGIREELLAITLHDLRQPVTVAIAALGLAVRRVTEGVAGGDALLAELLTDAQGAAEEIAGFVDTMSDASRVATGLGSLDMIPIRVLPLVESAIRSVRGSHAGRVRLGRPRSREMAGALVRGDVSLLHRALINLLSNAAKYSAADAPITVAVRIRNAWLDITVADTGIGMTPEEISGAFTRYRRSDRVRRMGVSGLGLGLYAARGIARAHGGDLTLTSAGSEAGTVARLRLPRLLADDRDDEPIPNAVG